MRHTPSGMAVCDLGLATNRTRKSQSGEKIEETTFVDVTAWGKTAELAAQYLRKGRSVFVDGFLKYDQWTTPEGQKRSKLTVTAENLQFLDSNKDSATGGNGSQERTYAGPKEARAGDDDFTF
jgi:single-strand DNA-binding protein